MNRGEQKLYIKKRWLLLFLVILIGVPILYVYNYFFSSDDEETVCCAKHQVEIPPIFTIMESTAIGSLDSSKATESITYNLLNQVEEGLMRLGSKDIPVPGLAESYQASSDYQTYTFTIRSSATWTDGKPVTANDFIYAWKEALSPANQYENAYLFFPIHNAQAYHEGNVAADQLGISAPDDHHLVVQLDNPNPNFLSLVTLTPFLPIRQDIKEKFGEDYASTPAQMGYTGPFQLKAVTPKKAVLIKNELYWDKTNVKLPRVEINVEVDPAKQVDLFKSELTGMIKLDPRYLSSFQSPENLTISKATTDYIEMNEKKPLLQNLQIRKAIQLALNRDEMVTALKDGSSIADEIVPPVLKTSGNEAFRVGITLPFRLDEAKTHLNQGLQELGMTQPGELTLLTYNDQHSVILAKQVKQQLQAIGLGVVIKQYNPGEKSKLESTGEYDFSIAEWSADYHDPASFLTLWRSGVPENISGFQNPTYDAFLDQAKNEVDPVKQIELYKQAEKYLIADQAVIMPLIYLGDYRLQKAYVRQVLYHPFGAEYTLKWATYDPHGK